MKVENNRLKQMLQEINNRGGSEVEQWKIIIEQEKAKGDQARAEANHHEKQVKV